MVRKRKFVRDRSIGFNTSMPGSWVAFIDKEATKRGIDRSALLRALLQEKYPVLGDPEKLKKYLLD